MACLYAPLLFTPVYIAFNLVYVSPERLFPNCHACLASSDVWSTSLDIFECRDELIVFDSLANKVCDMNLRRRYVTSTAALMLQKIDVDTDLNDPGRKSQLVGVLARISTCDLHHPGQISLQVTTTRLV